VSQKNYRTNKQTKIRRLKGQNDNTTEADYLDTLPPLKMAWLQKKTMYLLSKVYYTLLGSYPPGHFVDGHINVPLRKFQSALEVKRFKRKNIEKKLLH
jgi:hypothetical protein